MHTARLPLVHAAPRRSSDCARAAVLKALQAEGIPCSGGYAISLHQQPMFLNKSFGPYLDRARNGWITAG